MNYVTGNTIRELREKKKMTQRELADILMVSDKTVSKWETGKGLPDISILTELAEALSVSVPELLTGDVAVNRNRAANMKRSKFYVCPVCGNVVHAMGDGAYSCCGIRLPENEAEPADENHSIHTEYMDGDLYVHIDHPMEKSHYISFIAFLTDGTVQMEKLYPEQTAEVRFRRAGRGKLLIFCNRHGLFEKKL
ncbi:MAG: helix-turn-helix domain-containing protein [Eubacteriaceae bacterium]|nr:helix-turn-helix domain-containing protein [Eubacteriaceae bacterium]